VKTAKHGGALLVKCGAIIPTWTPQGHVDKGWSSNVKLLVYPAANSNFTLYEDDGESLGYRNGEFAQTLLTCKTIGETVKLTIGGRQGHFTDMPATRDFAASLLLQAPPQTVTLDGVAVTHYQWDETASIVTVDIPACGNAPRVLVCETSK
jgi:uncharacterized protein DUF5110